MILALSAIITPPDIFSQVLVCLPLLVLYEVGIGISGAVLKREKQRLEEDWDDDKRETENQPQ